LKGSGNTKKAAFLPAGRSGLFSYLLFNILGCGLTAVGSVVFNAPNNIAPGGASGVAIMVNYATGTPISVTTLCINLPLLALAWFFLGRKLTLKTMFSVLVFSAELELAARFLPVYRGDVLLAALYGGVFTGVGLALVFMRSSTTGGSDIASRLIQLKFPTVSVGKVILVVDGIVLCAAAAVYNNIENALYAVLGLYTQTIIIDSLVYGVDTGKLMMIVTQRPDEISRTVIEELNRSCTTVEGKGSFSGLPQPLVLCAVRKVQYFELKRIVHRLDPSAFVIALDAGEIIGEGFKDIEDSTKIT
jgi:uncharacterized membrane-anchored protein YitT (DUF2179 family)